MRHAGAVAKDRLAARGSVPAHVPRPRVPLANLLCEGLHGCAHLDPCARAASVAQGSRVRPNKHAFGGYLEGARDGTNAARAQSPRVMCVYSATPALGRATERTKRACTGVS